jgi:hypothetical protein
MLLEHLIPKLEAQFPGRFSVSGDVVLFPQKHAAVGCVEVHDDDDELTVMVGNFTHIHFANYESSLSRTQVAERIAEDALAFLIKLFADKIVMWGSHSGRGGCYEREAGPRSILSFGRGQEYVWSGPILEQG